MSSATKKAILARIQALEEELEEDVELAPFYDINFPEQRAVIEDDAPLIVCLCTRRSGKSFGAGALRLIRAAMKHPGSSCLFIGLTRKSAKEIVWKDCFKVINVLWGMKAKFNESDLTMTLRNGSVIYLMGVDTDEEEKEKLLGKKYAEVCIDEAASYTIDLKDLVYRVLKPAVSDYQGVITLIGTPGNIKSGLFYELTHDQDPRIPGQWSRLGWSGHRWGVLQNPHMRDKWQHDLDELLATNPLIIETPGFQQNYWGIWVIDDSKLVYRYSATRNSFTTLPPSKSGYSYVLGIDLGFNDPSSFTVSAYSEDSNLLYFVESYKKAGLDITAVSEEVADIKSRYKIDRTVIDGAAKQSVEELNKRHGLGSVNADKRGKNEFIEMMNAEMIQGRILLSPQCEDLKTELSELIWDPRALARGVRKEHTSCENHCTDGALYSWRHCYQWLFKEPKKPQPKPGTVEYAVNYEKMLQEEEARYFENAEREIRERKREEAEADEWA